MRKPYRFSHAAPAVFAAPLIASMLTACAVPDSPPYASIYPKDHSGLINDPGLALKVDFERRILRIDVHGESYTGELVWLPVHNSFTAQLLNSSGVKMECNLMRLLPEVWSGECTDSQGKKYVLNVGRNLSV